MSISNFQIAYDGEAVRSGSMDVHELASALLAIGDLVEESNRILNGDRASVSVRVESDFKKSSFEISLLVDQGILTQAKELLFGHGLIDAETLIKILFGGGSVAVITGVLKIYRALKGEKPKEIHPQTTINNVTMINTGSGQILKDVDLSSALLYGNDAIRDAVRRVVQPVEKKGIDKLEIRKHKEIIETVTKEEMPIFMNPIGETGAPEKELVNTREAFLKVEKVSFVPGQTWRFSDGQSSFGATIADKDFEKRVQQREPFYSGDRLLANLKTVQKVEPDGNIKTETSVVRVLEHAHSPQQQPLLPSMPKESKDTPE